jgi:hypothetical protein
MSTAAPGHHGSQLIIVSLAAFVGACERPIARDEPASQPAAPVADATDTKTAAPTPAPAAREPEPAATPIPGAAMASIAGLWFDALRTRDPWALRGMLATPFAFEIEDPDAPAPTHCTREAKDPGELAALAECLVRDKKVTAHVVTEDPAEPFAPRPDADAYDRARWAKLAGASFARGSGYTKSLRSEATCEFAVVRDGEAVKLRAVTCSFEPVSTD